MQRRMLQALVGRLRPSLVRNSDFGAVVNQVIPRLLRNEIAPQVAAELIDQGLKPILAAEFGKGE